MIFYYPINAITIKEINRLNYITYDAISINPNGKNNDCSKTVRLIDVASSEFIRAKFDLHYLPTLTLSEIDFVAIDRVNRFNLSQINVVDKTVQNYPRCDTPITGYSLYTNTLYTLKNINSFTDFTRHSLPVDMFFENSGLTISHTVEDIDLINDVEHMFVSPFMANKSRVTVNIINYDISHMLLMVDPYFEITGIDANYNNIKETLFITNDYDLVTKNEYVEISSIVVVGLTKGITIKLLPYIKSRIAKLDYTYIDREDFTPLTAVFSLDTIANKLNISRLNDTSYFPAQLESYESFDLDEISTHTINDYIFDNNNRMLYVISSDTNNDKFITAYPLIAPYSMTNLGKLQSSEIQTIKVEYTKSTLDRKYFLIIFPSQKIHGVEYMDISILHPYKAARGLWKESVIYSIGDLVIFNGEPFICLVEHISSSVFNINNFTMQRVYLIQDFLLDLISFGVETNRFEIDFDILFELDCESIINIETRGTESCILQILAQNHKLAPIVSKPMAEMFIYNNKSDLSSDTSIIYAIENQTIKLLTDKLNNYNYQNNSAINIQSTDFHLYSITSNEGIGINNYNIVNVFDTFYMDWDNRTIITSDTITHVINTDSRDISGYNILTNKFAINYIEKQTTDYNRVFSS
jgi:hypothetical protein